MYPSTEQIVAANKAATDLVISIANIQVAALERFSALTFNATKSVCEDGLEQAKILMGAKNAQELIGLNSAAAQPSLEKAIAYSRSMYDVALQAQREMTKVLEAHAGEISKGILGSLDTRAMATTPASSAAAAAVKSALAAAGSAYDSLSKISKQASELTEANFTAAIQGVKGRKKTA
ncbi:MAG: phasin family protein [Betaproteobacteria bacterium]|nr:phasin family protein [Betaproteobacteria bacterium]